MGESTHHIDSELVDEVAALRELAKFLVHGQDSDDLVQDTVIATLAQRDAPRHLGAWLRTVMRNQARARARSEGRRRAREDQLALVHGWFDAGGQLDEELGRRQLIAAMHQSLDELEAPYAELLRARFLDGRTPSEIAAELNCAPATVRWRLHEGLRRLRLRMDDHFEGRTQWLAGVAALLIPFDVSASSGAGVGTELHRSQEQHMITQISSWKFIAAGLAFAGLGTFSLTSLTQASASPHADAVLDPSLAPAGKSFSSPSFSARPAVNLASTPAADLDDSDWAPTTSGNARLFASAWTSPEWAHCPAMFDPELLDEAIEIGIVWEPDDEGMLVPQATATRGCYGEDLCSGVERPVCAEGQLPTQLPEVAACAQFAAEAGGPPEPGQPTSWRMWIDPAGELEHDTESLPAADDVAGLDIEEAATALAAASLQDGHGDAPQVFECGAYSDAYTDRARATVDELLASEPELRVYWLNFPIRDDARSLLMAKASVAATNQGKFRQFHDALFDKQNVHDTPQLMELARAAGFDLTRFSADLEDPRTAQIVANQREFCSNNGAIATPSFLIDGELVTGAVPFDELATVLDEARQP